MRDSINKLEVTVNDMRRLLEGFVHDPSALQSGGMSK